MAAQVGVMVSHISAPEGVPMGGSISHRVHCTKHLHVSQILFSPSPLALNRQLFLVPQVHSSAHGHDQLHLCLGLSPTIHFVGLRKSSLLPCAWTSFTVLSV